MTGPGALLGGGLPGYGIYDAKEGRVAIAALEPHFQERLYRLLALPSGSDLRATLRTVPQHEWQEWGLAHDVPIVACRDYIALPSAACAEPARNVGTQGIGFSM